MQFVRKHIQFYGRKTKSFFNQMGFRVHYSPPGVRDSLFSHVCVLPILAQSVPPKGLLNGEMTVLLTQELIRTAIKNSKTKTVFLASLPLPDFLIQNKTSKHTERLNLDV